MAFPKNILKKVLLLLDCCDARSFGVVVFTNDLKSTIVYSKVIHGEAGSAKKQTWRICKNGKYEFYLLGNLRQNHVV